MFQARALHAERLRVALQRRTKYTCVGLSSKHVCLGTGNGAVLFYDCSGSELAFVKVVSLSKTAQVSHVCWNTVHENIVAVALSTGAIRIIDARLGELGAEARVLAQSDVHVSRDQKVSALSWSSQGVVLFSGDEGGTVARQIVEALQGGSAPGLPQLSSSLSELASKVKKPKAPAADVIAECDSRVTQLQESGGIVLCSSLTRVVAVDLSKGGFPSTGIQIGKKLRKGVYGACFDPNSNGRQIIASRPGRRLWVADCFSGSVLSTLKLKAPKAVWQFSPFGEETEETPEKKINFSVLYPFDHGVVTWQKNILMFIDTSNVVIKQWHSAFGTVMDLSVFGSSILVLHQASEKPGDICLTRVEAKEATFVAQHMIAVEEPRLTDFRLACELGAKHISDVEVLKQLSEKCAGFVRARADANENVDELTVLVEKLLMACQREAKDQELPATPAVYKTLDSDIPFPRPSVVPVAKSPVATKTKKTEESRRSRRRKSKVIDIAPAGLKQDFGVGAQEEEKTTATVVLPRVSSSSSSSSKGGKKNKARKARRKKSRKTPSSTASRRGELSPVRESASIAGTDSEVALGAPTSPEQQVSDDAGGEVEPPPQQAAATDAQGGRADVVGKEMPKVADGSEAMSAGPGAGGPDEDATGARVAADVESGSAASGAVVGVVAVEVELGDNEEMDSGMPQDGSAVEAAESTPSRVARKAKHEVVHDLAVVAVRIKRELRNGTPARYSGEVAQLARSWYRKHLAGEEVGGAWPQGEQVELPFPLSLATQLVKGREPAPAWAQIVVEDYGRVLWYILESSVRAEESEWQKETLVDFVELHEWALEGAKVVRLVAETSTRFASCLHSVIDALPSTSSRVRVSSALSAGKPLDALQTLERLQDPVATVRYVRAVLQRVWNAPKARKRGLVVAARATPLVFPSRFLEWMAEQGDTRPRESASVYLHHLDAEWRNAEENYLVYCSAVAKHAPPVGPRFVVMRSPDRQKWVAIPAPGAHAVTWPHALELPKLFASVGHDVERMVQSLQSLGLFVGAVPFLCRLGAFGAALRLAVFTGDAAGFLEVARQFMHVDLDSKLVLRRWSLALSLSVARATVKPMVWGKFGWDPESMSSLLSSSPWSTVIDDESSRKAEVDAAELKEDGFLPYEQVLGLMFQCVGPLCASWILEQTRGEAWAVSLRRRSLSTVPAKVFQTIFRSGSTKTAQSTLLESMLLRLNQCLYKQAPKTSHMPSQFWSTLALEEARALGSDAASAGPESKTADENVLRALVTDERGAVKLKFPYPGIVAPVFEDMQERHWGATVTPAVCEACLQDLVGDDFAAFACRHTFHPSCLDEEACPACFHAGQTTTE